MSSRHKLLFLITAIILVPILLGTTPINLFQKLSIPRPHSQDKQFQRTSSCLFNSIVSQNDISTVNLDSVLQEQEPKVLFQINASNSVQSNIFLTSVPLRC